MAFRTAQDLDSLMGVSDSDIRRIVQSIQARLDKANAAAEIRSGNVDEQINQLLDRQAIDAQLAERKKRLSQQG